MPTTKRVSVTLPPEMVERAEEIARKENRTMSGLIREALEHYERAQWWAGMNAYGRERAQRLGLTETNVVPAVNAVRQARVQKRSRAK